MKKATFVNISIIALLFTATFVCYAATLSSGFVWDDEYLVKENPVIRAPLWTFYPFTQDIANSSFRLSYYYRPLQMFSYALEYRLWGLRPFGYHCTNLFIHFFNSVLIFFLIEILFRKKSMSYFAALVFVIIVISVLIIMIMYGARQRKLRSLAATEGRLGGEAGPDNEAGASSFPETIDAPIPLE